MKMTGFICHDHYLNKLAKLSDQEVGRLMRALMTYHASGEVQELAGRESIAFDFIKEDIDRAEAAYKEKCDTNRRNRTSTTVNDRQRPSTDDDERPQNINKNKKENKENKELEESKDSSCPALDEPAHGPTVIELPLIDGTMFQVTEDYVQSLESLYRAVDVRQQLRNMRGWLDSNPINRKTSRGIRRFITNWLSRDQDRRSPQAGGGPRPYVNPVREMVEKGVFAGES